MTEVNNKKRIQSQHFIYLQSYNFKQTLSKPRTTLLVTFFYKSNAKTSLEQFLPI